ncbi:flagellar motor switch phosphatase FliY [Latilactobacillus curvatus]|uniref:flagellar motor switch phosphatase FliY n=1 Tax=Latilactobacillus curvatus TaxID=28038 RepID=UPI0020C7EC2D|nr:flagellar motor switch phosphatase FliY [Latilactobacillus curvatus]MCP8861928.1 flagellar motor switch phosphatase FliY [Latilactobacillus curvatus]MCP8868842.1 flagellar motor switch phosphatase FliY [Latilactobacillus curvatus]MCP8872343.1 flagellar motor switch phosphatase FliY [Latilactobacillus curvatus]MCP8881410.1 flagellar motor switch phosphatase FliY [Latilactobacillus curvatus]MCS6142207.1 flagellar motor switch phosphatase FliY [Latilactobacillus curvatus]
MTESLTQEQIDALMNGSDTQEAAQSDDEELLEGLDRQGVKDLIGEVGNISMSQAATTLSSILTHRVAITTPRVKKIHFGELLDQIHAPKVATTVEFREGLAGTNLMLLEVSDATVIADLMMGGDGKSASEEFTEVELSAVGEAMNQMIGSASTSMATMINQKVDILPPKVHLWENPGDVNEDSLDREEEIYCISFNLDVEGLIESEIMQIFSLEMVKDIVKAMMSDKATVVKRDAEKPAVEKAKAISKPQPAPQQVKIPQKPSNEQPQRKAQVSNVEISKPEFEELSSHQEISGDNLDLILDIPLNLSVVLGRTKKTVRDILNFNTGSVIELDKLTDEPLEIMLNGKLIATGEVVVINENFGVRINKIISQKQRINKIN